VSLFLTPKSVGGDTWHNFILIRTW